LIYIPKDLRITMNISILSILLIRLFCASELQLGKIGL
jgi:bifunctional DNA-binding transcriptional regulator/antitoxin component of YhaV-PrlF toxin-antitoxin module